MTQFASTLYPQTNRTNPVLLAFRYHVGNPADWLDSQPLWSYASPSQADHAAKVLTRLASLTG